MTRADIGHYLSLTKESTCRLLKRLETRGLIRLYHKRVTIRRLAELCAAASLPSLASLKQIVQSP